MSSHQVSVVPLYTIALIAAAALAGCATSRLSADLPPGVRLAGDWKLDTARSDDLGKAVDELRAQAQKARRDSRSRQAQGGGSPDTQGPMGGRRHTRRGGQGGQQGASGDEGQNAVPGEGGDEMSAGPPRTSTVDELMSTVPRGDYLRIGVSANSFTVSSGDSSDQYTPGVQSEISAEQGDAQQVSGWKGEDYVIDTKPQWGAEIIQRYGLTKDGKLTMTVRLTGNKTRLIFTRIYDRTARVAPLAPPTIN
jgi:hypothetical protein